MMLVSGGGDDPDDHDHDSSVIRVSFKHIKKNIKISYKIDRNHIFPLLMFL
jgi:hypothetical protein